MNRNLAIIISFAVLLLSACQAAPELQATYDPSSLRFDGEQAFAIEKDFVGRFPNRVSGSEQTRQAAAWLEGQFSGYGLECQTDEWSEVLYSRETPLYNVVCRLPGASPKEIVLIAHHDIASTTVEGADNDGSGIAILLHLAETFAREGPQPYTLTFIATDGEEYGGLGTGRFISTHPDPQSVIAGFSLDNLGKHYYDGMGMETKGQYRSLTPLWLALLAREAAAAGEGLWQVSLPGLIDQITGQAAPVSFMDQGALIAAGVPALGFAATYPPQYVEEHELGWHGPTDTMEQQSPASLGQSGLVTEAITRQLLSMDTFPQESGPYLYFAESGQVLRGLPLWLIFAGFVALFFLGSYLAGGGSLREKLPQWRVALPHFLGLWLPLLASIILLYLLVVSGLMKEFPRYPATTKDPYLHNPNWPAVIVFLIGLGLFLGLGRWLTRRAAGDRPAPSFGAVKSLALLVVALCELYLLVRNPFSLLFLVPLLFWFLIRGRKGFGKLLDVLFFLLGGLVIYALIFQFGFVTLGLNFAFLWYLLNMFSIQMLSFLSAALITAIIAAGLAMVVKPPVAVTGLQTSVAGRKAAVNG